MSCYVMLCYVMLCYVMLYYVMHLFHVVLYVGVVGLFVDPRIPLIYVQI